MRNKGKFISLTSICWPELQTEIFGVYIHVHQIIKNGRPGPYNSLRHADNKKYFSGLFQTRSWREVHMFHLAREVGKVWRCSCWENGSFILIVSSNMAKTEQFGHLRLVYYFTVSLNALHIIWSTKTLTLVIEHHFYLFYLASYVFFVMASDVYDLLSPHEEEVNSSYWGDRCTQSAPHSSKRFKPLFVIILLCQSFCWIRKNTNKEFNWVMILKIIPSSNLQFQFFLVSMSVPEQSFPGQIFQISRYMLWVLLLILLPHLLISSSSTALALPALIVLRALAQLLE